MKKDMLERERDKKNRKRERPDYARGKERRAEEYHLTSPNIDHPITGS